MTGEADFGQLAEDLAPEDLRAVLAVFVSDVERLLGNLMATVAAEDTAGFQRVSHGLAGAAGAVGATQLDQACRDAMTSTTLSAADLQPIAARISGLAEAAVRQLNEFVDRLDAAARDG